MAVFCMATYGEGDPTDNAMEFVDWLKNGEADLTGLNYAVCINFLLYFLIPQIKIRILYTLYTQASCINK